MTTMESAAIFPLLPGKLKELAAFIAELEARQTEHDQTHETVTHESWFLQQTPKGDMVIVYLRAADTLDVFTEMALSRTDFALWFRGRVLDLTGLDLGALPPFSLPERIFHRSR